MTRYYLLVYNDTWNLYKLDGEWICFASSDLREIGNTMTIKHAEKLILEYPQDKLLTEEEMRIFLLENL